MQDSDWILLDTETTGFASPIFVVELAAQRMQGWEPVGEPFRKLLNQNRVIPSEAARVHGYTKEILERDGESAQDVYSAFAEYAEGLPLVSYNVDYDLKQVLKPEWKRLGIDDIGTEGFCALRLAQRLLDPVPAGNCKLQTLRQYYRLPERGAHTALGDVMTVVDLLANVLRPIAESKGLGEWSSVLLHADEEWYPSRFTFGKFKGQPFQDARHKPDVHDWLVWLSKSNNARSVKVGRWYLAELAKAQVVAPDVVTQAAHSETSTGSGIVIYVHPDLARLRELVAMSRARLAELEAAYTSEKANVNAVQARLFKHLRPHFEKRDRLRLVVSYRKTFLDTLLRDGEEKADEVRQQYASAEESKRKEYEATEAAMLSKHEVTPEEAAEIRSLWKKLVKLFHPDRYANDPEQMETYTKLTRAINSAKDNSDVELLRQIANDPVAFVLRQGWKVIDFGDVDEVNQLSKLLTGLEAEILSIIEANDALKESADFELYRLIEQKPELFDEVVKRHAARVEAELAELHAQSEQLEAEIIELSGYDASEIG
jgi:DNA polymerase-3 subunit epsilon